MNGEGSPRTGCVSPVETLNSERANCRDKECTTVLCERQYVGFIADDLSRRQDTTKGENFT